MTTPNQSRAMATNTGSMTWPDPMRAQLSTDMLERQRDLWLQLATSMEQSQAAFLATDLGELELRTEEQNHLFAQLATFSLSGIAPADHYAQHKATSDRELEQS